MNRIILMSNNKILGTKIYFRSLLHRPSVMFPNDILSYYRKMLIRLYVNHVYVGRALKTIGRSDRPTSARLALISEHGKEGRRM